MKREFDVHRDIFGPQVAFMMHVLADALQDKSIIEESFSISFPDIASKPSYILQNPNSKPLLSGESLVYRDITGGASETLKYFDYASEEYDLASLPFKEKLWPTVKKLIAQMLTPNSRVLDPSCGTGYEALRISKMIGSGEVVATDLSYNMVQRAYRNARLEGITNMAIYHADNRNLPDDWNQIFDMIFCNLSLHYFEDIEASLKEFVRVLQPNGIMVIVEPIKNKIPPIFASVLQSANLHFNTFYSKLEILEVLGIHGLKEVRNLVLFKGIELMVFKKMV